MSYAVSLLERFHYIEEVLGAHLLHTKISHNSDSPAALLFEKSTKIGAVIERTINLWTVMDVTVRGKIMTLTCVLDVEMVLKTVNELEG